MPPTLGYWKMRGLAQPIRLLLRYVDEPFEDKLYEVGEGGQHPLTAMTDFVFPGPEFNKDVWYQEKYALGLDFPDLPYFIDGDIKLTQSNAILRYIGRKHDMLGRTDKERVVVDVMLDNAMDFRNGIVDMAYSPHYERLITDYKESKCTELLTGYELWLSQNKWFAGREVTIVDFPMYELLDQHRLMIPGVLEPYPNLKVFMESFEALPNIPKYMASADFIARPVNNKYATFK